MPLSGSGSITWRLTAFFAVASTVVLLVLGYLIGRAVEQHFVEQDIDILSGKLRLTERSLERLRSSDDLSGLAQQLDDARGGFEGLAVAVRLGDGQVVFAGRGKDFPQHLFDEAVDEPLRVVTWTAADGTPWRGLTVLKASGIVGQDANTLAEGMPARIALALDTSHHEHFMRSFRFTLWTFVLLAAILIGALGYLAVRRGLRPLQRIRQRAEGVTAQRLDARLPVEDFPAELADLVGALNAMLSRLEASFVRLSDFSSDLAHEFRTPVSNLLMQAQVTLAKGRTAEEYREVLVSSIEEYERLSQMIADMLFIAQADEGRIEPRREALELGALASEMLDYYRLLADERGVVLTTTGTAQMRGDRAMLRRAVSNLLSNAVRHTPEGGSVSVCVESPPGEAVIRVSNSGAVIPAEHLTHLFDRFYRVDPARQRSGSGSGLGLAIVKSIVEAHGGRVAVVSDNTATTFSLIFPHSLPVDGHAGSY